MNNFLKTVFLLFLVSLNLVWDTVMVGTSLWNHQFPATVDLLLSLIFAMILRSFWVEST